MQKSLILAIGMLASGKSIACSLASGFDWRASAIAESSIIWAITVVVWFVWVRSLYFFSDLRLRIQMLVAIFSAPILFPPYKYIEPLLGPGCGVNIVSYSAQLFILQFICFSVYIYFRVKVRKRNVT